MNLLMVFLSYYDEWVVPTYEKWVCVRPLVSDRMWEIQQAGLRWLRVMSACNTENVRREVKVQIARWHHVLMIRGHPHFARECVNQL